VSPRLKLAAFLALVAAVAAISTWMTEAWLHRRRAPEDAHAWIHRQLGITAEQEQAISAAEQRFVEKRRELMVRIRVANSELGREMLAAKGPSPRVDEAIRRIHEAQAELQRVTVEHVFEMRAALRPDQYDKLLDLTASALHASPQ